MHFSLDAFLCQRHTRDIDMRTTSSIPQNQTSAAVRQVIKRPNVHLKAQTYYLLASHAEARGMTVPELLAAEADKMAAEILRKMAA